MCLVGKFLGVLLGLLLAAGGVLLLWKIDSDKLPASVVNSLNAYFGEEKSFSPPVDISVEPVENTTPAEAIKDLPEQQLEELSDVSALLERGENFHQLNLYSMAVNDFQRAAELAPQSRQPWNKLIGAQIAAKDFSAAESSLKNALIAFPNDKDFLVLMGEVHIQKSEFSEAKRIFEQIPPGGPRSFYLGVMAAYFEDYENAKGYFEEAKKAGFADKSRLFLDAFAEYELFPESSPLHLRLLIANVFSDLRFFELSIHSTKRILKERGDYRDAWLILGHSYLSLERYDLAINVLTKALEFDPTKAETSFFLGLAEMEMGMYDNAITHLSLARENGYIPQSKVTEYIAEAFLKGGFYESARKEYEKLVEVRGVTVEQYAHPIRISLEYLRDAESAYVLAQKAVTDHPTSLEAKELLAWSLLELGRYGEARGILEDVLSQDPNLASAHVYLGKVAEKEEKHEEALELYKKAYELSPHTSVGTEAAQRYNAIVLEGSS